MISTPGYDTDTVCWFDEKTKTIIAGDTLQGNGAAGQSIGFYMDVNQYRKNINILSKMDIENIILGHDFLPLNGPAIGKEASRALINKCLEISKFYDIRIQEIKNDGFSALPDIAKELIKSAGGILPKYLFLALYTAETHMKYNKINYVQ